MAKKEHTVSAQYYVNVENSHDVDKSMLEASKAILVGLKNFEHIKSLRAKKSQAITEFHTKVANAKSSLNKLQRMIPKAHVPKTVPVEVPVEKVEIKEEKVVEPVKVEKPKQIQTKLTKEQSEVEALEAELAAIESKLTGLG